MATAEALRADLDSPLALSRELGFPVAPDWPPRHWDEGPIKWLLDKIEKYPDEVFWRAWFIQFGRDGPLVGSAGCKGPPDEHGVIEIGYGVVESHWRRGIASHAAEMLISWIAETGRATRIRAHTLAGDPASAGVLLKNGFVHIARMEDPVDGAVDRFERDPVLPRL